MDKIRLFCLTLFLCHHISFGQSHLDSTQQLRGVQLKLIKAQLHVREKTGHNDGPEIDMYRASVARWLNTMKPKPAWCACFYYYLHFATNVKLNVKSARAREYFSTDLGSYRPLLRQDKPPSFGDAVGYVFGKSTDIRHIGYVYEWSPDPNQPMCRILEGNTSSSGVTGIVREGDGVYIKWRAKSSIYRCTPLKRLINNGK